MTEIKATDFAWRKNPHRPQLNDDDTTHDLAFPGEHVGLPTTAKPHKVRQTETYAVTFDLPGTYEYVCKRHLDYDMKGSVIVE